MIRNKMGAKAYKRREKMENGKKKKVFLRVVSGFLGFLVAFSVFFSGLFLYVEKDHECEGEHCPICEIMAQCEKVLTGMKDICCHASLATIGICILYALVSLSSWVQVHPTPVSRKIQLNN